MGPGAYQASLAEAEIQTGERIDVRADQNARFGADTTDEVGRIARGLAPELQVGPGGGASANKRPSRRPAGALPTHAILGTGADIALLELTSANARGHCGDPDRMANFVTAAAVVSKEIALLEAAPSPVEDDASLATWAILVVLTNTLGANAVIPVANLPAKGPGGARLRHFGPGRAAGVGHHGASRQTSAPLAIDRGTAVVGRTEIVLAARTALEAVDRAPRHAPLGFLEAYETRIAPTLASVGGAAGKVLDIIEVEGQIAPAGREEHASESRARHVPGPQNAPPT